MTLEAVVVGAVFVLGTIAIVWASYFAMRLLAAKHASDENRELSGSVIFRISALHGLILALIFADEMLAYHAVNETLLKEATAVADIYNDVRRYGDEAAERKIKTAIRRYLEIAAGPEWQRLGARERLSPEGWEQREVIYETLLNLEPSSPRQKALHGHMLQKVQLIAELRQARENVEANNISDIFWAAAISGVVLVALAYFSFAPSVLNLLLLSIFGAFTGLIMAFIYAFSNPFSPPALLEPAAFHRLLNDIGVPQTQAVSR